RALDRRPSRHHHRRDRHGRAARSVRHPSSRKRRLAMGLLGFAGLVAIVVGAYWWAILPQLRKLAWWDGFVIRLWALAGNSKTIVVAYAAELLGLLDEAKLLD